MNILAELKNDTIAALATPPGRGGIGILRVSGPRATAVSLALLGKVPRPRQAEYTPFLDDDGTTLDHGIGLFFLAPHSFTGEDVLELQGHGGPVILDLLLQRIVSLPSVRIAYPGEFSERAFINDKLDFVQAEAVMDLINANSIQAARSAVKSLRGAFSKCINELAENLTNLRMHVEAVIDFPDEDAPPFSDSEVAASINTLLSNLNAVRTQARRGSLLREGMRVVIAGYPNAGKSSLLNALAGYEAAIVTDIPGTTRDALHEYIHLDGMPLHVTDTAGLRSTSNEVEKIGIERAWREIKNADHILLIVDGTEISLGDSGTPNIAFMERLPSRIPVTIVRNKADLTGESSRITKVGDISVVTLSVQSGMGMDLLCTHLKKSMGFIGSAEGCFLARRRHLTALETVSAHLLKSKEHLVGAYPGEILAEELRLAQQALGEITGQFSSEDLRRRIFASFCIGK